MRPPRSLAAGFPYSFQALRPYRGPWRRPKPTRPAAGEAGFCRGRRARALSPAMFPHRRESPWRAFPSGRPSQAYAFPRRASLYPPFMPGGAAPRQASVFTPILPPAEISLFLLLCISSAGAERISFGSGVLWIISVFRIVRGGPCIVFIPSATGLFSSLLYAGYMAPLPVKTDRAVRNTSLTSIHRL